MVKVDAIGTFPIVVIAENPEPPFNAEYPVTISGSPPPTVLIVGITR
jgi:hypothetical protein